MRRSRDSGIFWPGQDRVKQDPNKTFALSVHNSKKSFYTDVPPLYLDDGTWVIKYSVQARVPLVFETRITTVKCSTAWNVASQSESYLQPWWAIRCSALRLLSGSSQKTDGLDPIRCFLRPIASSSIAQKRSVNRWGFCRISVFGFGIL